MSNQNLNNLKNVDGDNKLTIENLIFARYHNH